VPEAVRAGVEDICRLRAGAGVEDIFRSRAGAGILRAYVVYFRIFLKYYNIYGAPAYFLRDFLHECCNFSVKQKILQLFFRNVVFFQKNHFFYNIRLSGTGENG